MELKVDVDLYCSECRQELVLGYTRHGNYCISPCDCQVKIIEDLKERIEELEAE